MVRRLQEQKPPSWGSAGKRYLVDGLFGAPSTEADCTTDAPQSRPGRRVHSEDTLDMKGRTVSLSSKRHVIRILVDDSLLLVTFPSLLGRIYVHLLLHNSNIAIVFRSVATMLNRPNNAWQERNYPL